MRALRVALIQMSSGPDVDANMVSVRELVSGVERVDLAILPECAVCRGGTEQLGEIARPAEAWVPVIAPLAEQLGSPVVAGGVPVCDEPGPPRRVFNSSLVVSPEAELLARYDKMHLFQLTRGPHTAIDETETYTPGGVPAMFEIGAWQVGLSICYDLRFPELFRQYVPAGIMICTAAFTMETGRAHWQVLLRARAIENQCYMLGVGQCGPHPSENVEHYGHSMCVEPWGRVLAEAGERPTCLTVELNHGELLQTRERIPALCKPTFSDR